VCVCVCVCVCVSTADYTNLIHSQSWIFESTGVVRQRSSLKILVAAKEGKSLALEAEPTTLTPYHMWTRLGKRIKNLGTNTVLSMKEGHHLTHLTNFFEVVLSAVHDNDDSQLWTVELVDL
jgi:hypothetical protein